MGKRNYNKVNKRNDNFSLRPMSNSVITKRPKNRFNCQERRLGEASRVTPQTLDNFTSNNVPRENYREKAETLRMNFVSHQNSGDVTTKNILAVAAGLTDDTSNFPLSGNYQNGFCSRAPENETESQIVLHLPEIIIDGGEDDTNEDDDIMVITQLSRSSNRKRRKNRKKRNVSSTAKLARKLSTLQARSPKSNENICVIEISDSDDDSDVVIIDENIDSTPSSTTVTTHEVFKVFQAKTTTTSNEYGSIVESETLVQTTSNVAVTPPPTSMAATRHVRHFRVPPRFPGLLQLPMYLDSLSYHIARNMGVHFRGPLIIGNDISQRPECFKNLFRIVTYNVLCHQTMQNHLQLYPHLNLFPHLKNWDDRWAILAPELMALNADIYCFQEIEKSKQTCYDNLFLNLKKFQGFCHFREENCSDGCAIYFNPCKFHLDTFYNIKYNHKVRDLDKPNVGIIARLIHKPSGKPLIIVNTHILFNPGRGDIKLYQLVVLFAHLNKIRRNNEPVIFCGDLNIEPHSPIYNFIVNGSLDCTKETCIINSMSGQIRRTSSKPLISSFTIPPATDIANDCTFNGLSRGRTTSITHPFTWASSYTHYTCNELPEISTYHQSKGNPDFIFYTVKEKKVEPNHIDVTEEGLHLFRRLSLPDAPAMKKYSDALPHPFAASDHIPLLAEFSLS